MKNAAISNATKSAIGAANTIPLISKNIGKIISKGTKNKNCLVNDTKIPFKGFPIDAKKFPNNGNSPFVIVNNILILKYMIPNSKYKASPFPKKEIIYLGKN